MSTALRGSCTLWYLQYGQKSDHEKWKCCVGKNWIKTWRTTGKKETASY